MEANSPDCVFQNNKLCLDRAATRSWPPVPAAVNSGPGVNGDKIFYKLISPRTSPDDWNPAGQTIDLFILLWAFLEHVIFHLDIFRVVRGPKMPHFHTHSTLTIVSFHISAAKKIDHDGLLRKN